MFGIDFETLVVLAILAFILFGPQKLPEYAEKLGRMMAKLRQASSELSLEVQNPFQYPPEPPRQLARPANCPHCAHHLLQESTFCPNCGRRLKEELPEAPPSLACPQCQRPVGPEFTFCPACGHRLKEAPPAAAQQQPAAS